MDKDEQIKYFLLREIAMKAEICALRLYAMRMEHDKSIYDTVNEHIRESNKFYASAQMLKICCDLSEVLKK